MKDKLIVQNISKSYGKKPILRDISIHFAQNEIVGLLGPNGDGKTTLLGIIVGLIKRDFGFFSVSDQDITNLPIYMRARLGIAYLPQESSVFQDMSVIDNIKAILEIKNQNRQEVEQKALELLDEFSITHLKNKPATTLSGGERRRLEIARSLATNPRFILLDEPLAGIDPLIVKDIKTLILLLKNRNIGVLITDHNARDTLDIVDRAYIIYDGKVLMEGNSEEIINSARVREIYLGNTFG